MPVKSMDQTISLAASARFSCANDHWRRFNRRASNRSLFFVQYFPLSVL